MEELETELSFMPGYKKPENVEVEKESLKSRTDPECGYIHQARKKASRKQRKNDSYQQLH
mgnify:CR=1 FL=1|jgi:hypothetical protein